MTERRRGAALEKALLDAAWEELADNGYARFTMDGVVKRAVYKGGTARIEFSPAADPDIALHFEQPDPNPFEAGSRARMRIVSGWLIPGGPA